MTKRTILSAAAAIALAASSALAADKLSKGEEHFLKEAAVDNMCEIKMSEVAQSQATDPQVKQFAQQMIQDHQQAGDQLKQLAESKGVKVPNDLPKMKQEGVDALKELQGKDFDQAYISAMKADHLKDVSKFSDKAQLAKDQDVKSFAAQLTPKLQQHTQHVMTLAQAQGLPMPSGLGQAQPAGATISPDASGSPSGSGASGASGSSSGTSGGTSSGSSSGLSSGSGSSGSSSGGSSGSSSGGSSSGGSSGSSSGGSSGGAGSSGSSSGGSSSGCGSQSR